MFVREITASGLFDNHLRQQSCLSWLSIIPRRLFHDKPGKNPDYSLNNRRGIIDNQLRQLCCRRWLSNKPEAVISRTNMAKSPDYSYYNILGQLCKHVLSQFVKGITEYSLTNFRSGTLNLSKLACYFS